MPKNRKAKLISLYSIQVPILALAIALLTAGSLGASKYLSTNNSSNNNNAVLGDDDKDDSDEDKNDESNDEDKNDESNDEDKNDESNDEDKNDESNDEDKNDESNDEDMNDDSNDANELEDEDDLEDSDDSDDSDDEDEDSSSSDGIKDIETEEIVVNADGTRSKIKKVTRNGVLIKMKVETINSAGKKVSEKEFESGDDLEKKEFKLKTYDAEGNEKTKFEFKNELGREIQLKIRDNDDELSLLEVDDADSELRIKELGREDDESELSIKLKGNGFEIENKGFLTNTNFPLVVDDQTGLITVSTPLGEYALKVLPDEIKVKIEEENELDDINSSELLVGEDGLEYSVTGVKKEKLLGLFNVELNKILNYDSSTGDLLNIDETFMTKLLDLLSF